MPEALRPHLDGFIHRSGQLWGILGLGTILAAMGLLDDRRALPWLPRLIVQFAVAAVAVFAAGVQATVFAPSPEIGSVLSVCWILVLVNSFNFLDNMDGLSSGIALIAAALCAVIMLTSTAEPRWFVAGVLLILAGAIGGFLFFHNWPPARIFMGDSGSYFIGFLVAAMTLLGTFYDSATGSRHVILAPLCLLAIPLYDFCSVMAIRLKQRRSPFHPDKSHFSHRLVELGLKPRNAVLTIHLATLTTGLGGLLLYQVPGWTGAGLVVALVACVLAIVAILEFTKRRRGTE
jgi:UDP-GlcNAc:undecaprenyl-phosphate GlcNAc-1-phosphate transferase